MKKIEKIKRKAKDLFYFKSAMYFGKKLTTNIVPVNFLESEIEFKEIKNPYLLKKIIEKKSKKLKKKYPGWTITVKIEGEKK